MNQHGFIKVSRKMFRHAWWLEPRELSQFEAWLDLIQMAEWRTSSRVGTQFGEIEVRRGEFLGSIRSLAARWHWGEKRVRLFLERGRQKAQLKTQRETQAGVVYLIVKYDEYQSEGTAEDTAKGTGEGHTKGTGKEEELKNNTILFEEAWAKYPRRRGGNPKRRALEMWMARVRAGVDPAAMLAGVERYAAFCEIEGKVGTPYVQMASTFFGPSCPFEEAWDSERAPAVTAAGSRLLSITEAREQKRRDLEEVNRLRAERGEAPLASA